MWKEGALLNLSEPQTPVNHHPAVHVRHVEQQLKLCRLCVGYLLYDDVWDVSAGCGCLQPSLQLLPDHGDALRLQHDPLHRVGANLGRDMVTGMQSRAVVEGRRGQHLSCRVQVAVFDACSL
jgi:hypothetical protein